MKKTFVYLVLIGFLAVSSDVALARCGQAQSKGNSFGRILRDLGLKGNAKSHKTASKLAKKAQVHKVKALKKKA